MERCTVWIDGGYEEWNSKKQQLVRFGIQRVILKRLENVENANQRWFEEAKSHFNLSKLSQIVQCYGLTQDPLNGNYMLYCNAYVGISSGQPPFGDYGNDYYLAKNIFNGMRPRIVSGTPLEYERLIKQCWDADPSKRPHTLTVFDKISEIILNNLYETTQSRTNFSSETNKANINYTSSRLFTSKIYQFGGFPEPRNATEEEQEAFYSKSYDNFYIPDDVDDFNKSSNQKNNDDSEGLSKDFNKLQINSKDEVVQNVYKMDVTQQQVNKHYTDDDDVTIQIFVQKNKMELKFLMKFKFLFTLFELFKH
ncbi:kinase-like domain-containing protein [Rhizophagus irregularis DAOM 181602=DAOM 197198]|nr:kinase-like domain-containing protein [Rhizophagus irregularis DAOM 181602=DAOM 197198]